MNKLAANLRATTPVEGKKRGRTKFYANVYAYAYAWTMERYIYVGQPKQITKHFTYPLSHRQRPCKRQVPSQAPSSILTCIDPTARRVLPATPWAERPGRDNRPAHENAHRHDGARLESRRDHEIRLAPFNSRRNGLGIEFRSDNRCKSNFQYPDSRPVANLQDTETGYHVCR